MLYPHVDFRGTGKIVGKPLLMKDSSDENCCYKVVMNKFIMSNKS